MYFTKRMQKEFLKKIKSGNYTVYSIKLKVGMFEDTEQELSQIVDVMFLAWKRLVASKSRGYLKNYDGIIRRLFFEKQKDTGLFSPFFYLLCVRKRRLYSFDEEYKIRIEEEKLRIQTYIKWFSAWASALKVCGNGMVGFSIVELENLERVLGEFCTNEKYTLFSLVDEVKRNLLKMASGNGKHKLVSYHGIFRSMNRQQTVER